MNPVVMPTPGRYAGMGRKTGNRVRWSHPEIERVSRYLEDLEAQIIMDEDNTEKGSTGPKS